MAWSDLDNYCQSVEIEANSESPDIASFSNEVSRATLVLKLTPLSPSGSTTVNLLGPILAILGNSHYSSARVTRMSRTLPLQHPMWGWLFATEIASIQGRGPRKNVKAEAVWQGAGVNWQAYDHYRVTVVFTGVKYAVKKDDPLAETELYRFVERHFQLGLENITRQGNSFRWVPGAPLAGQTLPFGFIARAQKGVVTYLWRTVTRIGLFGTDGNDWPRNIVSGIGRVNEKTFDGVGPGQLLLLPPKFIPHCTPFSVHGGAAGSGSVGRGTADLNISYDVELPMSYIAPPLDPAFDYASTPLWAKNGHNLFPPPPGATTHYWYPATQTGAFSGDSTPTLYRPYDFTKLFKLMGAND